MDVVLILLVMAIAWHLLRAKYQRERIGLLASHLTNMNLERHLETLTTGYSRAIHEDSASRQRQVFETFAQAEQAVATNVRTLAESFQKEAAADTAMTTFAFCAPYPQRYVPAMALRDFRALLQIHAAGIRQAIDHTSPDDPRTRAFHIAAELYLFQHSCHWFCKSRAVADARLMLRHKVDHAKVLASVTRLTQSAYSQWLQGAAHGG